MVDMQ